MSTLELDSFFSTKGKGCVAPKKGCENDAETKSRRTKEFTSIAKDRLEDLE